MGQQHASDHDLDRYYLGMVTEEEELAEFEEHILGCPECAERAAQTQDYVDIMRVALLSRRCGDGLIETSQKPEKAPVETSRQLVV